ncbi:MAG: hypothetical protein IKH57_25700 [Clostridia bacterium]|nr:hypothetical protein [Clostridia bacterium]
MTDWYRKENGEIDREKVIDRLNNEITHNEYWDEEYADCVPVSLLKDVLELLKAHEPRVMTLDEVKEMKRLTICAVEQRSKVIKNTFNAEYGGIVTLGNENFLDFGLYADTSRYRRTEAGYGKSWRCWTSRPTEEQREKVKWE